MKAQLINNKQEILEQWLEEVENKELMHYSKTISEDLIGRTNNELIDTIFIALENETGANDELQQFAEKIVNLGWPIGYITEGMQVFRSVSIKTILEKNSDANKDYFLNVMDEVNQIVDPIKTYLINQYSTNWDNIVSLQKLALEELSAPLIPVMDDITVMPLVGTIDTDRAKLIMENLLSGIVKHRTDVVLIDITGVPVVDTMVAHHIIQAAEAVRLLGATCILVGIRPEIAQTIVNLGIDLSNFPTKSSLSKGFQTALQMTDKHIISSNKDGQNLEQIMEAIEKE